MKAIKILLIMGIAALAMSALSQDNVQFKSETLGLSFSHPANWEVQNEKLRVRMVIPIAGTTELATLDIFSVTYQQDIEGWQRSQYNINRQMRREIEKQWEEQVLNVPMLMTKVLYSENGKAVTLLTGLLYSATPQKLSFRLTAPTSHYDDVEYVFRSTVLRTLETTSGDIPQAEDPSRAPTPTTKPDPKPVKPPKITRITKSDGTDEIEKGSVIAQAKAAGRNVNLFLPEGWEFEVIDEGSFTLKHADMTGAVKVHVLSTLDSDPPSKTLFKTTSETLKEYAKVMVREEKVPKLNKAGATYAFVWRKGTSASGDLSSCDAVGAVGDYYWVMEYRLSGEKMEDEEKALIDDLIQRMSVEVVE